MNLSVIRTLVITSVLALSGFPLFAEDPDTIPASQASPSSSPSMIRIGTLYGGIITNKYEDSSKGISMKDSGFMSGIYGQWIKPETFQANMFGYWSPDVNYSRVLGIHANVDGYFLKKGIATLAAGIDVENIHISMDAGSHVEGLSEFEMENNVFFGMLRTGTVLSFSNSESLGLTVFPYIGFTRQKVSGDVTVDPNGPPMMTPETKTSFSDTDYYLSWGINTTARVSRYAALTAKYLGRAEKDNYMHSFTLQANIYLSRSVFLSYQCKYMELSNGYDLYNIAGIGVTF